MAKILFDGKEAGQLIAGKTLQFQTKEGLTVTAFGQNFDVIVTDKGRDDALALRSEDGKIEIVEEPETKGSKNGKTTEENPTQGAGEAGDGSEVPGGANPAGEPTGTPAGEPANPASSGEPAGATSSGDGGGAGQPDSTGQQAGQEEQGKDGKPAKPAENRKFTVEQ